MKERKEKKEKKEEIQKEDAYVALKFYPLTLASPEILKVFTDEKRARAYVNKMNKKEEGDGVAYRYEKRKLETKLKPAIIFEKAKKALKQRKMTVDIRTRLTLEFKKKLTEDEIKRVISYLNSKSKKGICDACKCLGVDVETGEINEEYRSFYKAKKREE